MLIPFVWLYVFKCDVYTQLLVDQTQKDFLKYFLYVFLKSFYTFVFLEFLFKMSISCFYQKNLSESFSRVSHELALPAKMTMAKIGKHWISDKNFCDCLTRNIYPQNSLHASVAFSRVILREAYLRKARVFSFKR